MRKTGNVLCWAEPLPPPDAPAVLVLFSASFPPPLEPHAAARRAKPTASAPTLSSHVHRSRRVTSLTSELGSSSCRGCRLGAPILNRAFSCCEDDPALGVRREGARAGAASREAPPV